MLKDLKHDWRKYLTPEEAADHVAAKAKADAAKAVMRGWNQMADAIRRKGVQRARASK